MITYHRTNQNEINMFFDKIKQAAKLRTPSQKELDDLFDSDEEIEESDQELEEEEKEKITPSPKKKKQRKNEGTKKKATSANKATPTASKEDRGDGPIDDENAMIETSFNDDVHSPGLKQQAYIVQTTAHKSIQTLDELLITVRHFSGHEAIKLDGTIDATVLFINVSGALLLLKANGMDEVRRALHVRRYYVIIGGKAIYLDYHIEILLHYMFFLVSEKGLQAFNPSNDAYRDLTDSELFENGSILHPKLIDILQANEPSRMYLSRVYENWKGRLKRIAADVVADLIDFFPKKLFDNRSIVSRPVRILYLLKSTNLFIVNMFFNINRCRD